MGGACSCKLTLEQQYCHELQAALYKFQVANKFSKSVNDVVNLVSELDIRFINNDPTCLEIHGYKQKLFVCIKKSIIIKACLEYSPSSAAIRPTKRELVVFSFQIALLLGYDPCGDAISLLQYLIKHDMTSYLNEPIIQKHLFANSSRYKIAYLRMLDRIIEQPSNTETSIIGLPLLFNQLSNADLNYNFAILPHKDPPQTLLQKLLKYRLDGGTRNHNIAMQLIERINTDKVDGHDTFGNNINNQVVIPEIARDLIDIIDFKLKRKIFSIPPTILIEVELLKQKISDCEKLYTSEYLRNLLLKEVIQIIIEHI